MPAILNEALFAAIEFRSDALSILANIVHPLEKVGTYSGTIGILGQSIVRTFDLEVDDKAGSPQATIDLAEAIQFPGGPQTFQVSRHEGKAYLVLTVTKGHHKYYVTLDFDGSEVFDSRNLSAGDQFAVVLFRPGEYAATHVQKKYEGKITVNNITATKGKAYADSLYTIEVLDDRFDPQETTLNATDTVAFAFATNGAVRLQLGRALSGEAHPKRRIFNLQGPNPASTDQP